MSNSSTQKIKSHSPGFLSSPLLRPIIAAFLFLIALELALVFYLLHDIRQAEQTAQREYQYLSAAHSWSELADLMRTHRRVVDATRTDEDIVAAKEKHNTSRKAVQAAAMVVHDTFEKTRKLDSRQILNAIQVCLQCTTEMYDPRKTPAQRERWYQGYLNSSKILYETALAQVRTIHAEIGDEKVSQYREESLLACFLIVDLIICVCLASFIEKQISKPLSKLAKSCQKLMTGEILPSPPKQRNEIDFLQETFHEMSVSINKHEQGRRSYIELFKQMHSSRLLRIQELISDLAQRSIKLRFSKLEILESNVNRTLYLLDTMTQGLAFNEGSKLTPKFENSSSTELFQTVQSTLAFMLKTKAITLVIQDPDCKLSFDPHLLSRAVTNLLGNACKFSPKSSQIILAGKVEGEKFRCEIIDQGPGISKEQQEKLFKRFSQLEHNQSGGGGSGLGLLIAKQIVESHNGMIGCTSEEGKGTTFWFEIPLSQAAIGSSISSPNGSQQAPLETAKLGSIRTSFIVILLVFVISQFVMAFQLNSSLQQVARRANNYAKQKVSIVETQRFIALFFSWRQRSFEAAVARNKRAVVALFPLFLEQTIISKKLLEKAPPNSKTKQIFTSIHQKMTYLQNLAPKIMNSESLPPIQAFPLLTTVDETSKRIENDLFKALEIQNAALDRSYDLTTELRETVSKLLITTLIINLVLIAILFLACISIIKKLAHVNEKARAFARGEDPVPSIKGNDELTFLDKSLCKAAHSIREAEAQRRELLAIINHDLRTPLSAMLMGFELLSMESEQSQEDLQTSEDSKAKIARANNDIQFLIKQISDLLDLEKMESGALEPDSADLVLEELLEDTVDSLEATMGTKKIDFVRTENADDIWVRGEISLLRRIFEAVIQNAMAYAPPSSPIKLSIGGDDRWAIINVSDNGPGIDRELLQHIFDRFRFSGGLPLTGVGIPLAYRLAKIHGGRLEIQSSPNDGTSVFIFLPRLVKQLKSAASSP